MFWTNIKRVTRLGFVNFWRNGSVSLASVLIMTVALFIVSMLLISRTLFNSTLSVIEQKVDINVYFTTSATEEEVFALKQKIETLPEVLPPVEYSSREEELEKFKARHEDDELTIQALDEIGGNPLGAVLNIRAKQTSQYEGIARFLEEERSQSDASIIDKINYNRNKVAIDTLSKIIDASKQLGFAIVIFAVSLALLITFNTIRLTIFMAREEIAVMRLVGASRRYIRGPFVVAGLMYGFVSTIISSFIVIPVLYWAGPYTEGIGTGINVFNYYISNIFYITGVVLLSGLVIGSISSYTAVKKYLKV